MDFRNATHGDAERILRFWKESGASIGVTDEVDQIRRVATNRGAVLLLAVLEDEIVGTLLGTYDGWRGNMYRLVVVHPARRRQGIARELVRRVEQVFAEWGVRRITALIEVDRPSAAAFWTSVGYPRDGRIVRHLGILDSRTATTQK
jgi:GNAT superfamily N-acetyltransferase